MDTRFNSFYSESSHAFVTAMNSFLIESGYRAFRPSFITDYIYTKRAQQYAEDMELMLDVAKRVIARRRAAPTRKRDLVDAMIHEKDPITGKHLPEDNIIRNMITFLIAGNWFLLGLTHCRKN
jgi:cytochrome P450/NADPH-cytochrome P450 reductase